MRVTFHPPDAGHPTSRIEVLGRLKNPGRGVALDIRWEIQIAGLSKPIADQYSDLAPLDQTPRITLSFPIQERLGTNSFEPAFTAVLTYRNIFGDRLKTTSTCQGEGLPLVTEYDLGALSEPELRQGSSVRSPHTREI